MSIWNIYHKDGTKLQDENGKEIVARSLEYSDTWMGECFVTITFENEAPIDFSIGDYIEYRGEKFEINYDPGKIKVSSKNSYGAAFKYDSVKFNSLSDELARCEFLDVVLDDNNLHYTALPKFSFYVSSLDDLLDRILANLNEQIGENEWKLFSRNLERSKQRGCTEAEWNEMYGEGTEDNTIESKSITVDQKTCWEALALVNSEWDVNFVVRGRNVYVGTAGLPTANVFKYGKGNGLYEIEQNSESDQKVITRLRAYGSDKNLPSHYYADLGKSYSSKAQLIQSGKDSEGDSYVLIELTGLAWPTVPSTYYSQKSTISQFDESYKVKIKVNSVTVAGVVWNSSETITRFKAQSSWFDNDASDIQTLATELMTANKVYFVSGVNGDNLPDDNIETTITGLPNNMACSRLMLPGFPHQSLQEYWDSLTDDEKKYANPGGKEHRFSTNKYRPYIDSLNIDDIGTRQGSAYFDTDDEANGIIEIYPTIEEMTTSTGQRLDEIYKGSEITDDGRFDDGQTIANFTLLLRPEIDFDINDIKQSDFTICMKDGMCGGREFSVEASSIDYETGCWKLTLARQKDDALEIYFPYKDYQINAGDHFVLTGIELPESYIKAASLKLLKWAIAYLDENDYTRYVYQPKIDEIFMARQHDEYLADDTKTKKSLYLSLKAGDLLSFADSDLAIDGEVTIDSLSIKEDDGKIPTYEVTLREDKEVGTIKKIQNQISSLASGNGNGTGNGTTVAQTKSLVQSEGSKHFLSKTSNDTAQGHINFKQGLTADGAVKANQGATFGEYVKSLYAGKGAGIDASGNAEVESLRVRSYMQVMELIVNRLSALEGDQLLTESDTIESVDDLGDSCYGLHLRSKWDGYFTAQTENNVLKGIVNTLAKGSGEYYTAWMRVNSVSTANNYIEVTMYADADVPSGKNYPPIASMNIARWGNQTDTTRQDCLYFSSTEGRIVKLKGVTKPILDKENYGVTIGTLPDFVSSLTDGDGNPLPIRDGLDYLYVPGIITMDTIRLNKWTGKPVVSYVDRGLWTSGEKYYCEAKNPDTEEYETSDVWYQGCKYRCCKNLTETAPAWNNTDWAMIEGNPAFTVDFEDVESLVDPDNINLTLTIVAMLYNIDVTQDIVDSDVSWTRYSEDADGNERVDSDNVWAAKHQNAGKSLTLTRDDMNMEAYTPKTIRFTATVVLRDGMGNEASTASVSYEY